MPTDPDPTEQSPPPSRLSGLPVIPLVIAGIVSIGAFATLFSLWARTTTPGIADTLRIASEEYAARRPAVAAKLAQSVEFPEGFDDPELYHLREFLIGAGIAAAASEDSEDMNAWRLAMHEAIPHLQTASAYGFPPGRDAEGKQLLGEALLSKGRFAEAAEQLALAIEVSPASRIQLMPLLIESQLLAENADPDAALRSADTLLQWLSPDSNAPAAAAHADSYYEAKLLRGRALAAKRQWPLAREQFREVIDSNAAASLAREARLLEAATQVSEAIAIQSQMPGPEPATVVAAILDEAMQTLADLDRQPDPLLSTQARLWIARAQRALNQTEAAISAAASVRQQRPFGAESIAGGTLEVELLAEQQRGLEVLQTVRYMIREIGDPRLFDGRIVGLEEFRRRITAAAEQLRIAGDFQIAVDLARSLPPVFANDDALMLESVALTGWAEDTLRAGSHPDGEVPPEVAAAARQRYHAAGDAAAAAADERFTTSEYVPTLWSAISAYEKSRDFERMLQLIEPYLRYEDRVLKPRALIAKGRALLALDQPRKALAPLDDCIAEHPRDSLRYEARLIAAMAHAELNQLATAQQLLDENLYDGTLAPESPVWRDSLNLLGQLLYRNAYRNHLLLTDKLPPATGLAITPAVAPNDAAGDAGDAAAAAGDAGAAGDATAAAGNAGEAAGAAGDAADEAASELAQITFRENQELLESAIRRLEETAEREQMLVSEERLKDDASRREALSRAQHARYLAARSRQMAAHWPAVEAASPDVLDMARRRLKQTRDDHLQKAMDGFTALRQALSSVEEQRPLSEKEQSLLRNCFLAEADVLRESGKWPEAAEAYRGVSLRYMNQPAALEAMLGQARCMEDMGRQREATLIIRQAERVLERIPPSWDPQFAQTTRYDRQQWQRLLAWLAPAEPEA